MIPAETDFKTEVTFGKTARPLPENQPFRILLMGNWSGDGGDDAPPTQFSDPVEIDRDNFDEILGKLNVRVNLELGGDLPPLTLKFNELDDFHPDRIFNQVELFDELRDVRRRLQTEEGFSAAAAEVREWLTPGDTVESAAEPEENAERQPASAENLLDDILGRTPSDRMHSRGAASGELGRLISKLVAPHVIQTDENERQKLTRAVDQAGSELMRAIIHDSAFKELEASWRSVYMLVRRVESGKDLKIFLLSASKEGLQHNLKNASRLDETELYRIAVRDAVETPGAEPWAVICGNYSFTMNVDDAAALIRISQICKMATAPFLSHLSPGLFGLRSVSEAEHLADWEIDEGSEAGRLWTTLRSLPEANLIGLGMPRFLTRLPYGAQTDPVEKFEFEEFAGAADHENYVWGNPAFIFTALLAQAFSRGGWEFERELPIKISGLPAHIYRENGETVTKPCAEILMTDHLCNKLLENGLMPLISFKNSDQVQVGRFQSIASPQTPLEGRWN